jgi:hypothetical protein
MLADSTCRLLICDFDGGTWRLDAAAYAEAAAWASVPAAIEISRSGEGAHVWTFFAEPVAAVDARAMGAALLREAMAIRGEVGMESYDRFFPAQDYLPKRGFGNLIALPLEGTYRKNGTTLFVDPAGRTTSVNLASIKGTARIAASVRVLSAPGDVHAGASRLRRPATRDARMGR